MCRISQSRIIYCHPQYARTLLGSQGIAMDEYFTPLKKKIFAKRK